MNRKIEIDINTDLPKIVAWLQSRAKNLLEQVQIDVTEPELKHLISETQLRNIKIRSEYRRALSDGTKTTAVIYELSKQYKISERNIRLIVYGKR